MFVEFVVLAAAASIELAAYLMIPAFLARLAFVPVGRTYRVRPTPDGDTDATALFAQGFTGVWDGRSGWFRLAMGFSAWNPAMGVARVDSRTEDGVLVLSARALPLPVSILLFIPFFALDASSLTFDLGAAALATGIIAVAWLVSLIRLRNHSEVVHDQIATHLQKPLIEPG